MLAKLNTFALVGIEANWGELGDVLDCFSQH
jgi:hypothetical protein